MMAETEGLNNSTEKVPILRVSRDARQDTEDIVVREKPLTIILNKQEVVTLLCSPTEMRYLAVGYLISEGLLTGKDDIKLMGVDEWEGTARVETRESANARMELVFKRLIPPGCGRGASLYNPMDASDLKAVTSDLRIAAGAVFELMRQFQHRSVVYRSTGGVHSAALCDADSIIVFSEDIGRHNAIDKIMGRCALEEIPTRDKVLITSGRISSEVIAKIARSSIPVLISKSAPTDTAIRFAERLGITLIGFVRGTRMNCYSHSQRVMTEDSPP